MHSAITTRRGAATSIHLSILVLLLAASSPATAAAQSEAFEARLSGGNQVPSVQSSASGSVIAILDGDLLRITGSFNGLASDYAGAHIHVGATGETGDFFVALEPEVSEDARSGIFAETMRLDEGEIDQLRSAGYYVNVFSDDHPEGEIRGQLYPSATRAFGTMLHAGGLNPPGGRALASLNGSELQVTGYFWNLSAPFASAGIHTGYETSAFQFAGLNVNPDTGERGGTILAQRNIISLSDQHVEALLNGQYWLKVFSQGQPVSELIGQLLPAEEGVSLYRANLSGFNEVPYVNSPGVGQVIGILGPEVEGMRHLQIIGSVNYLEGELTEAHLYQGTIGQRGEQVTSIREIPGIWEDNRYGIVIRDSDYMLAADLAEALVDGELYVSVGSSLAVDGELRGQLLPLETLVVSTNLTGDAAVPSVATSATGNAALLASGGEVRVTGFFEDLSGEFTAAGLHVGDEGQTFPAFASLTLSLTSGGTSGAFIAGAANSMTLSDERMVALREGRLYVQVSSTVHSSGELRGSFPRSGTVGVDDDRPHAASFVVNGNYPNPFSESTQLLFDLSDPADVEVEVFDLLGRRVVSLAAAAMSAGSGQSVEIDGSGLPAGIYLYRLTMRQGGRMQSATGRLVLVR